MSPRWIKSLVLVLAILVTGFAVAGYPPQGSGGGGTSGDSEWITYTPVSTWTTNCTWTGAYRITGDNSMDLCLRLVLSGGGPNAASLEIDLPPGWENRDDVTGASVTQYFNGRGQFLDGALTYEILFRNNAGDPDEIRAYYMDPTSGGAYMEFGGAVTNTAPRTWGDGDTLWVSISDIPVQRE